MIKNQHGFTYPLTLAILMAFLIFFSLQVQQLLTEKKMYHETKTIWQQEYYMLTSVKKIETMLQTGEAYQSAGSFAFMNGILNYQIDAPSGTLQKITLTLHLNSGETALALGYYDLNDKKIRKWAEKN